MRFLLGAGVVGLGLVLAGVIYQAAAGWWDRCSMTGRGRFVRVGAKRFFVCEMGEGGPAVVFESGLVASTLNWLDVQRTVSAGCRTFSYDRLGLGWSDASDSERTPGVLAAELRALLREAGVAGPYVLVAHSYGALIARAFAVESPWDVAGIVLVDPMRTEGWLPSNVGGQHIMKGGRNLMWRAMVPTWLGLTRVAVKSLVKPNRFRDLLMKRLLGKNGGRAAGRMTRELCKMPAEVQGEIVAQWSLPGFYVGSAAHIRGIPASVREMQAMRQVEEVPTVILRPNGGPLTADDFAHCVGSCVQHVVVDGSGHWMHLDKPDAVVEAVLQVQGLRNGKGCDMRMLIGSSFVSD